MEAPQSPWITNATEKIPGCRGPGDLPHPGLYCRTCRTEVGKGDVFRHVLAGAGGWGDPLERDPAAVLRDVRNELLSLAKARDDYGVMIDPQRWQVDVEATARRRSELRASRGWRGVPKVQWTDPPRTSAA